MTPPAAASARPFASLLIAVYLILSILLFGLALWRNDRERHLKRALSILLLAPLLIVVLGLINNGIHGINWLREAVGAVQMFVPLWAVVLVQWLILHMYLSRQATPAEATLHKPLKRRARGTTTV